MLYSLIYADPPWTYRDQANAGERGAVHKYPLMTLDALKCLYVQSISAPNCLLAMWWTGSMIREALELSAAWGFTFKTANGFTWHKTTITGKSHFGMGNWTRANTESVLFATRGRPKRISAGVRQFVEAPVGRHSAKPDEVRTRLVTLLGDVPRVELFARGVPAPGWDVFGNETEGSIAL